jgi:hypothetical protein
MKNKIIKLSCALFATASLWSCEKMGDYTISNNSEFDIVDKNFTLSRKQVESAFGKEFGNKKVMVVDVNGEYLPTQNDDLDLDGKWDELAFVVDMKANSEKNLNLKLVDVLNVFPAKTNVRFGYKKPPFNEVKSEERLKTHTNTITQAKFQMEGPAWENDKVGFRNYFDLRNRHDIFGKISPKMALDGAGIKDQNYHKLDWWGLDILKVGNSLGAGSVALLIDNKTYEISISETASYRLISEGPVRAIFELTYNQVKVKDRTYNIKNRISISAGDYYYKSEVIIDKIHGDEIILTGVVNKYDLPSTTEFYKGYSITSSFGMQSEHKDKLGMALIAKKSDVEELDLSSIDTDIDPTHFVCLKAKKHNVYYFLSAWEKSLPDFSDASGMIRECKKSISEIKN